MSKEIDNFYLLNSSLRKFILNDEEVLIDLVKTNLNDHRFKHTLGVAKLAKELALIHHVDVKKAFMAGILHDLCKNFNEEECDEYLKYYDRDKLNFDYKVKHSYVCKYYLKEKLHIHDSDVLNAIYNHTILKSNDKLSLILYIADKREENRQINDEVVKVARKDLKKAVNLLVQKWKDSGEYIDGNIKSN